MLTSRELPFLYSTRISSLLAPDKKCIWDHFLLQEVFERKQYYGEFLCLKKPLYMLWRTVIREKVTHAAAVVKDNDGYNGDNPQPISPAPWSTLRQTDRLYTARVHTSCLIWRMTSLGQRSPKNTSKKQSASVDTSSWCTCMTFECISPHTPPSIYFWLINFLRVQTQLAH